MNGIGSASSAIDFNPRDPLDLPLDAAKAKLQIAAIKTSQDVMSLEASELARIAEPEKGNNVDARA